MTRVAVLGAGAGGAAATVELTLKGEEVALWNRSAATIAPYEAEGELRYRGALGEGAVRPALVTTDLARALDGADVAVVCLPALAHSPLFAELATNAWRGPTVLNPGHTCGALHFRAVLGAHCEVAELSTLTYVARRLADGTVNITGVAARVGAAALPGGERALEFA